jgi:hypothetical protein
VLELLANLYQFPVLTHDELLQLVASQRLWGRGLGTVDANLLGSALLVGGAQLWTRDKRLTAVCGVVGAPLFQET